MIEMLLRKLFVSSVASLLTLIGYHLIQWEFFEHPKYLRKTEKRLKYLQQMVSRQKKDSAVGAKLLLCLQNAMSI